MSFLDLFPLIVSFFLGISPAAEPAATRLSEDEARLYDLIMDYRESEGLERVPLSNCLTIVAQTHAKDLSINRPDKAQICNLHSWSRQGKWSPCCYTDDHARATCMWDKPSQLTSYKADGFEIACSQTSPYNPDFRITPEVALELWQNSPSHNEVVLNLKAWEGRTFHAVGIGMYKGFATVWFGFEEDPSGAPISPND